MNSWKKTQPYGLWVPDHTDIAPEPSERKIVPEGRATWVQAVATALALFVAIAAAGLSWTALQEQKKNDTESSARVESRYASMVAYWPDADLAGCGCTDSLHVYNRSTSTLHDLEYRGFAILPDGSEPKWTRYPISRVVPPCTEVIVSLPTIYMIGKPPPRQVYFSDVEFAGSALLRFSDAVGVWQIAGGGRLERVGTTWPWPSHVLLPPPVLKPLPQCGAQA